MFTVFAYDHMDNPVFEASYLNFDLAMQDFNTACKCVDCRSSAVIDATTGELIFEWNYVKGLVYPK